MTDIFQKAQWIMAPCESQEIIDKYFEYRTTFMAQTGAEALLYISASTQYVVYINGQFVDCGQYEGYEDYQVYDTLDISKYLQDGENELWIGHYVCGEEFSTRRVLIPGIIFEIHSGEQVLLYSDEHCEVRANTHFLENREKMTPQLGFNFEYNAKAMEEEFGTSVLAAKEKHLYPRPIKKLDISDFDAAAVCAQGVFVDKDASKPKAIRMQDAFLRYYRGKYDYFRDGKDKTVTWSIPEDKQEDGVYLIFDLQKECTGLLEFELEVSEETEVLIGFGEHLDDLRVRAYVGRRHFCFRYLAKAGKNTFFYPYQRMGLRYLQFHVYSQTGNLRAGIRHQSYPLTKYPSNLQDKLHQRIYDVASRTLELCMHEHYEDCPWREQALYAMDSRVQILCGYYAFKEYEFPRACLDLMARSLKKDGYLELCAPGTGEINIPAFTAVYVREVWEYVQYSGDYGFLEQVFDVLKKIVDSFACRIEENHLISRLPEYWNFYEWTPGMDDDDFWTRRNRLAAGEEMDAEKVYDAPINAFVSDAFDCFAEICRVHKPEMAAIYMQLHEQMNEAIHKAFWDEKSGAYLTSMGDAAPCHILTQGLMLCAGAVPQELVDKVSAAIVNGGCKSGSLIPCSVSMTIYVYEALLKHGNQYKNYIQAEIERIWGKMLAAGATTFWETEAGADDFNFAGSLCHGWSAVPIYIWGRYFGEK